MLYEVVERLKEKDLNDKSRLTKLLTMEDKPQPILDWFAREDVFAASLLLSNVLDGVSGIFKIIQQGPQWLSEFAKIGDASGMETTVVPILDLLAVFKRMQNKDLQLEQINLVVESTLKHSLAILQGERENDNIATDEEAARGKAVER